MSANSGIFDEDVIAIAISPRNPALLFAATSSFGIFRSLNRGTSWLASNSGITSSVSGVSASALTVPSAAIAVTGSAAIRVKSAPATRTTIATGSSAATALMKNASQWTSSRRLSAAMKTAARRAPRKSKFVPGAAPVDRAPRTVKAKSRPPRDLLP